MRTVPEWVATHDDQTIPKRVKLRIFARCGGRCGLSGLKINVGDDYDFDHIKALWRGGEHRESNLHPVLRDKHREKSAAEQGDKAKADRVRAKHLGLWPKSAHPIRSRGFDSPRRRATVRGEL
jgi:5-methylcytosine-specific restriction protein A